ncbi:MAG: ABC transporter substrate-binding protein [Proteobacteria bacterium]|nr:ABC transporter substrate-binding protein [Pseudomonadota bacterium]MBU1388981.1 ABC transporter substrate-binding protein [Pseudomonadota bacterium]MBU1543533.1 ABC transporter substrate-binding protein [Pseudomonadota bacterium]MBU2430171.1 ABC transporter substrate-binding protein [Pseudomonadota bacterium]MBU2480807.1 ABC transporter substrate-binding protein [Pseudomonadota bacterium]
MVLFWLPSEQGLFGQPLTGKSITIKDATGTQVEVRLPVKRLVVLNSDALEVIRSLGASDLVVGVYSDISKNPLFWPELKERPKVGTWKEINYERVIELNPDAVVCYGSRPGRDMEKKLQSFGIQIIRLDFFKPDTLEKEIKTLGKILDKESQARKIADWYHYHLNQVQEMVKSEAARPKVYMEGDSNYHTAGPGSGGNDICMYAGGSNIAANFSIPYPEVTPEWILTRNPDVIVKMTTSSTCSSGYGMTDARILEKIRAEILSRPAWTYTNAVKKERIFVIANEIWTGPRAIIGICYLAKWFFPERTVSLDPMALHKEYLEEFQKVSYQGVYVYP